MKEQVSPGKWAQNHQVHVVSFVKMAGKLVFLTFLGSLVSMD